MQADSIYSARAANKPAPSSPNAMSGRAAASVAEAVAEAEATADATRLEAAATSLGAGSFFTSVQIWLASSVASVGGNDESVRHKIFLGKYILRVERKQPRGNVTHC